MPKCHLVLEKSTKHWKNTILTRNAPIALVGIFKIPGGLVKWVFIFLTENEFSMMNIKKEENDLEIGSSM